MPKVAPGSVDGCTRAVSEGAMASTLHVSTTSSMQVPKHPNRRVTIGDLATGDSKGVGLQSNTSSSVKQSWRVLYLFAGAPRRADINSFLQANSLAQDFDLHVRGKYDIAIMSPP